MEPQVVVPFPAKTLPSSFSTLNGGADFEDSDETFRNQFNPSHPSYHNGDPTPAAFGGTRIPKGMEAHADWQSLPIVNNGKLSLNRTGGDGRGCESPPEVYEEEYTYLLSLRESVGQMKKDVNSIAMPVKELVQIRLALSASDNDPEKTAKLNKQLAKNVAIRDAIIEGLESLLCKCVKMGEKALEDFASKQTNAPFSTILSETLATVKIVSEVREMATADISNKDVFGDFMLKLNGTSRKLFAQQNLLLQLIKKLKKSQERPTSALEEQMN